MKKLLIFISILTLSLSLQAQSLTKVTQYKTAGKTYNVSLDKSNENIYIDCSSSDENTVRLRLGIQSADKFILSLNIIKEKLVEWTKVAKENNITELDKPIQANLPFMIVSFVKEGNSYVAEANPYTVFMILSYKAEASYGVSIFEFNIKAYSDPSITTRGYSIDFKTAEDVDSLIAAITTAKATVSEKQTNQQNIESLFQ